MLVGPSLVVKVDGCDSKWAQVQPHTRRQWHDNTKQKQKIWNQYDYKWALREGAKECNTEVIDY